MAGKSIIDEIKKYLPYFYSNNNWVANPKFRNNGRDVEDDVVDFMSDLLHFLLESNFLSDCTLIWLKSNLSSVKDIFDFYNTQCDYEDRIQIKTAQNKINHDKVKLSKYFGEFSLFNLMAYPEEYLESARETLDLLLREFCNDSDYRNALVIRIPKDNIVKELDDFGFMALMNIINRYSLKTIREIEAGKNQSIDYNIFGYYNYLISSKRLTQEDKNRLAEIRKALGLDEKE